MATPQPEASLPAGPRPPRSSRPHRRRGRGSAKREGQQQAPANEPQNQAAPQAQPTQSQPQPNTTSQPSQQDATSSSRRGGNREGRGRRQRNNGPRHNGGPETQDTRPEPRTRGMRARGFEAQLTRPDQAESGAPLDGAGHLHDHALRADVPEFVPGKPPSQKGQPSESIPSSKGKGKARQPNARPPQPKVTTKSTADDLATRIHEDISHNLYECPICCSELGRRSRVWSCELCWTVFHLSCVKKWSTNEGAAAQRASAQENGQEDPTPRAWRCPGCNLSQQNFPTSYSCWVAPILVMQLVMLVRVRLVLLWVRRKIVSTEMLCKSKDEEEDSRVVRDDGSEDEWTGCFNCGETCNRPFDCGKHSCQKNCHPQDPQPAHCPRSPDVIVNCACGKTPLSEIPGYTPRTSCEDPILNCQKPCGKTLPCGHPCEKLCHVGSCGACLRNVHIKCNCGRTDNLTICHQGQNEPPQCPRMCKATLHCGRHTCTERCCPGEQRANERQAARRKLRPHLRPADEDIEAEHICTRPCGAKPPACNFPCERPKRCGHPQASHTCHTDEENCPKCPFLTEKACLCGKRVLKNVPCWLTDARCGQVCGQLLKCGSHFCRKDCHRPEDCEDATNPCSQPCGKNKTMCGHPCTEQCHAPYACPEKTPCSSKVAVTCGCGRLRQERRCNAAKAVTSKGQVQSPQRQPELTPLTCDDECTRLERNRSLAGALGIDINQTTTLQTITAENLPYSEETLNQYVQLASSVPLSTLQTYEANLHSLAAAEKPTRSFRFQPAKSTLRAFAHSLAADWGFVTESHDPEPHRHVFVLKPVAWTPPVFGMGGGSTIGIGGMSVRECVKLRERERSKEQEARRVAALEAKATREAAKAQASAGDGGWAQVASKSRGGSAAGSRTGTPVQNPWVSKSIYAALDGDGAKKERLVLRSGVGVGKSLRAKTPAPEVVDDWEEAEEKEEKEEAKGEGEKEDAGEQDKDQEMVVREDPEGKSAPAPEIESPAEDRPTQAEATQAEASVTDDVPI
ncbi:FKBP12-associated protein [Penicillium rubens]|nr:FKBP12-associated protein [Penicillium rubens]